MPLKSSHIEVNIIDACVCFPDRRLIVILGFSLIHSRVMLTVVQTDTMKSIQSKSTKLGLKTIHKNEMLHALSASLLIVSSGFKLRIYSANCCFREITNITFEKNINCMCECKTTKSLLIGGGFEDIYCLNLTSPFQKRVFIQGIGSVLSMKLIKRETRLACITKSLNRMLFVLIEMATQKTIKSVNIPDLSSLSLKISLNLFSFFNNDMSLLFYFVEHDSINDYYQQKGFGIWRFYPFQQLEAVQFNIAKDTRLFTVEQIKTSDEGIVVIKLQGQTKSYAIIKEHESIEATELYKWQEITKSGFSDLLYVSRDITRLIYLRDSRIVYETAIKHQPAFLGKASSLVDCDIFSKFK